MRQEKQLLLDEMREQIEGADSFVIARHHGMTSLAAEEFRGSVIEAGGEYEVVRKRVFLKAATAAGVDGLTEEMLQGSIGVVFAKEDGLAATKAVCKFQKDNKGVLEVLCGRFDSKVVTAADVETLSKLPSKDEMRAQLLGTLVAPMTQTLGVMQSLLTSVIYCIDNKVKKDSEEQ